MAIVEKKKRVPPTRVTAVHEASIQKESGWKLCLQWCVYQYGDGTSHKGYRFIWRRPNGKLQPARGQARLPSLNEAQKLTEIAQKEGWGRHVGEDEGHGDES